MPYSNKPNIVDYLLYLKIGKIGILSLELCTLINIDARDYKATKIPV